MQQHMMQKHNIRVSLRDKDDQGRVIERPLPRPARKGVKADSSAKMKPYYVSAPSPAMSSTSESEMSDAEEESIPLKDLPQTQPVMPIVLSLTDIPVDNVDACWQPYVGWVAAVA